MFDWFVALIGILFINLILSGDNLVIIALACRRLPDGQRKKAMFWGSVGMVVIRILLTFVAASILDIPYLQILGGLFLLWVAVDLLSKPQNSVTGKEGAGLSEAIRIIIIADLVISLDNVLTIAGIAQTIPNSKYSLITVGLAISISMVAIGAQLFMKLVDRYIIFLYFGAGMLGYAGAAMIVTYKALNSWIAPYATAIEVFLTIVVVLVGHWRKKRRLSYQDSVNKQSSKD
jgi:YjbE family integral membrane protein